MATSPNLGITYLDTDGQDGAETAINDVIIAIDALLHLAIEDRDLSTPPGSPSNGQRWLVKATGTGDWAGHDGEIAGYYDGWRFWSPQEGFDMWVKDENKKLIYDGSSWSVELAQVP